MKHNKGQTLIETAVVLVLLLIIILGITEFSRAWFTKNSLKNAARHGARLAVVTPGISCLGTEGTGVACSGGACPNTQPTTTDEIKNCVCSSPGINEDYTSVSIIDVNCDFQTGDEVKVKVFFNDSEFFIVGGSWPWPWPKELDTFSYASMRYEP